MSTPDLLSSESKIFQGEAVLKIETVILVETNLSKEQVEEILKRIISGRRGRKYLKYLNIKRNNVSLVKKCLLDTTYNHLKSFLLDKYI